MLTSDPVYGYMRVYPTPLEVKLVGGAVTGAVPGTLVMFDAEEGTIDPDDPDTDATSFLFR